MATNSFISNDNKKLLWDMLQSNNMFYGIEDSNFTNVKIMFENVIMKLGLGIKDEISREKLLSLNKSAILEIKTNLEFFKHKNNQETVDNEKILVFDRNLETARNDFSESISIKKPTEPEFSSKIDTPFSNDNMNELLSKLQKEREELVPPPEPPPQENRSSTSHTSHTSQISKNPTNSSLENSGNRELKKLSKIEDIFSISKDLEKKVSFMDTSHERKNLNDINTIHNLEYRGEKMFNNNELKMTSIFNLLKEIDEKQNRILELLNNQK